MRAVLNEEQEMLRTTAEGLAKRYAVRNPSDLLKIDRGACWKAIVETGLLGLRIRQDGAPVTSCVEVMLVAEALAGALTPAPYIGTTLAQELLVLGGMSSEASSIADGAGRYTILLSDDLKDLGRTRSLNGSIAADAEGARYALGLSETNGQTRLFRVDLAQSFIPLTTPDFSRVWKKPEGKPAIDVVGDPLPPEALDRWCALALTLVCADIVGVLRSGLQQVVEYSKTRIQYGVPVGSFQAVQHMCAAVLVKVEAASSMTRYAAWTVDELSPAQSLLAAHTAKAHCAGMARTVAETIMQAFGGIGQTWEHIAPLMNRRAMLDSYLFGDEAHQLLQISDIRLGAA